MSVKGRPEILFPLFGDIQKLKGIGPKTVPAFEAAGLARPRDVLLTLPHSGIDRARKRSIRDVVPGEPLTYAEAVRRALAEDGRD